MHWITEIVAPGLAPLVDRVVTVTHLPSPTPGHQAVDTPMPQAFRSEDIAAWVESGLHDSVRAADL